MMRRHVRSSDFGSSPDDDSRFGARREGHPRREAEESHGRADAEAQGRGQRRDTHRESWPREEYRHGPGQDQEPEAPSRMSETLDSVASWIEKAQQQLAGAAPAAGRPDSAARPESGDGTLSEALAAIRRLEDRLSDQGQRSSARAIPDLDETLRGFEARLGEVAGRLGAAPGTAGRRPLKSGAELKSAVEEIRSHQTRLERDPPEMRRPSGLPALGTLARSQTAMLTTLRQEISQLATRINEMPVPGEKEQQVQREVETLRRSMAEVARRDDLSRLEKGLQSLTEDIMELRRAGEKSTASQEIAALQSEIRRLSEHRPAPDLAGLQAEIRRLSEQKPAPVVDMAPIAQGIQSLSRKLDRVADGGVDPSVIVSLSDQIEQVRRGLAEANAPRALGAVDQQLSAIRREIAEIGGRQVAPREFETLRGAVEELRASLESLARTSSPREEAAKALREIGRPIEATLTALVDKIERVERRVSDPEALDHLERQIQAIAARMGEAPSRDPAIAGLERSMSAILDQVSSWRDGAIEAAEHAARTAVAETIDSMPVAAEVERHLVEIGDRYAAAEERTRQSLSAVQSALSDVMTRLSSLESGSGPAEGRLPAEGRHPAESRRPAAAPPPAAPSWAEEPAAAAPLQRPAASLPAEADAPLAPPPADEVLLEPGAARPPVRPRGTPRPSTADAIAAAAAAIDSPDIKSSFIAAARRAAQAAAAESASAAKARPAAKAGARGTMSPSDMLGRVRALIDSKRRPLLLAAAAIVLALGTVQIVRTQMADRLPGATVTVTAAKPVAPAAPVVASRRPAAEAPAAPVAAAERIEERAEVTAATNPAPPPVADPVTTQSIAPAPETAPPAAPEAAAPKEPARIAAPAPLVQARQANAGDSAALLPVGLKEAADRGDPVALYDLAARAADGRGVARDPKMAASLFGKAAEKGLVPAQYRLGNSYERGLGVPRDIEKAKSWYRRAAAGGNVRAMHNLAVLLADGAGGKPDYAGAVEWFSKAAEHGVKDSQFNLAVLYARGLGTSQDFARAYHWLAIAAQQGDEDAARKRDDVGRRLSPADLARAKAGVESWQAAPAAVSANEVLVPPKGFTEPLSAGRRHSKEARI